MFENKRDAGRQLAALLLEYRREPAVVLAIPNGGVPVGLEIAEAINAEFDLMVCRKIPLPLSPEGGFGAIADDGTMVLNDRIVRQARLTEEQIEFEANQVRAEVKRRSLMYKGARALTTLFRKNVILVDDGLASGMTMTAAVESVRRRHPGRLVVAVPAASALAASNIRRVADRLVTCWVGDEPKFYIADYYRQWRDLGDNEVIHFIRQWQTRNLP
jgi:predicted phosphoribosyltransferase